MQQHKLAYTYTYTDVSRFMNSFSKNTQEAGVLFASVWIVSAAYVHSLFKTQHKF